MSNERKRTLKYLGILFLAALSIYKLPHDSYSISEILIKPIRFDHSNLELSGMIPLILLIISIRGIFRLEKFKKRNKLFLFIIIVAIIIPSMHWSIDVSRTCYHWIKNDGLNSVDIKETELILSTSENTVTLNFKLEIMDYGKKQNHFNIRVFLPNSIRKVLDIEYMDLNGTYHSYGNREKLTIEESIPLNVSEEQSRHIFDNEWYYEEVKYKLYNEKEEVIYTDHCN